MLVYTTVYGMSVTYSIVLVIDPLKNGDGS